MAKILLGLSAFLAFFLVIGFFYHKKVNAPLTSETDATKTVTIKQGGQVPDQPAPAPKALFFDALNGQDRIITNEYAHWNVGSSCPTVSPNWDMTSGTLLVKNGSGYSGIPTVEDQDICSSAAKTNSAVFRLTTKNTSFMNTTTSMDFMLQKHGGGGADNNSYDGINVWVRYQSEYALYAVAVGRWDGTFAIKKKVPENIANCKDPSNDGCYYDLSPEVKRPGLISPNVWHHAEVSAIDDSKGALHITLRVDGKDIMSAIDNGTAGPVYHSGSTGVRGDNSEFYFKNFTVMPS